MNLDTHVAQNKTITMGVDIGEANGDDNTLCYTILEGMTNETPDQVIELKRNLRHTIIFAIVHIIHKSCNRKKLAS